MYQWAFGVATVNTEKIKQLFTLPHFSYDPSVVRLLCIKELQVPTAAMKVHWQQYCTVQDPLVIIHEVINQLENEEVINKI